MAGQVAGFLWITAAIFFLLAVFVLPTMFNAWRRREQADKKATEEVMDTLGYDRSGSHILDGA